MVASLPSSMSRSESLAAILQVALVFHFPPHGGVPVVFDGVVCPVGVTITFLISRTHKKGVKNKKTTSVFVIIIVPSRKKFGDLCPAIAKTFVGLIDNLILFLSP